MSQSPTAAAAGRLSPEAAGSTISELFDRHGRAVLGLCRLLLRDAHDAEDATQSTFLAAHGALLRGSVPRDGGAWITEIARNECRARIRERMKAPLATDVEVLHVIPATGSDPGESMSDGRVHKALAALPERQRHAVVLHDVFGLRAREVATALGVSLTAVEALVFRARRQLRVRLRPVAGALTLPIGIRDTLAAVIPGFSDGATSVGVTAGGGLGVGLLAKLASAQVAAKVTAATVAVTAAGSVVVVEAKRQQPPTPSPALSATTADHAAPRGGTPGGADIATRASATSGRGDDNRGRGRGEDRSGRSGPDEQRASSGPGSASEHGDDDDRTRSGPSPSSGKGSSGPAPDDDGARVESSVRSSDSSSDDGAASSSEPIDDDRSGPPEGSESSSSGSSSSSGDSEQGSGESSGSGSSGSGSSGSGSSSGHGSSGSGELEPDDD